MEHGGKISTYRHADFQHIAQRRHNAERCKSAAHLSCESNATTQSLPARVERPSSEVIATQDPCVMRRTRKVSTVTPMAAFSSWCGGVPSRQLQSQAPAVMVSASTNGSTLACIDTGIGAITGPTRWANPEGRGIVSPGPSWVTVSLLTTNELASSMRGGGVITMVPSENGVLIKLIN